jgi:hypothetical protein
LAYVLATAFTHRSLQAETPNKNRRRGTASVGRSLGKKSLSGYEL